jgi:hypothetical protein
LEAHTKPADVAADDRDGKRGLAAGHERERIHSGTAARQIPAVPIEHRDHRGQVVHFSAVSWITDDSPNDERLAVTLVIHCHQLEGNRRVGGPAGRLAALISSGRGFAPEGGGWALGTMAEHQGRRGSGCHDEGSKGEGKPEPRPNRAP